MTYFKTNYYIKPKYLKWIIGVIAAIEISLSKYIPLETKQQAEIIFATTNAILLLSLFFYLIFESFDKPELEIEIRKLEERKRNILKYSNIFDKEQLLKKYKKVYEIISDNKKFVHLIKSNGRITEESNLGNYIMIYIIFLLGYDSVENLKPVGPNIFIVLIFLCILFCITILIWEGIVRKRITSPIIVGHILAIYLLFSFGKSAYIRSYGDEELGSYFEKSEYKTQYYINIFPENESNKKYRLPAKIHVFSQSEEGRPTEDYFGQEHTETYTTKFIILEKVLWPNDGYLYFNCPIEIGEKTLCKDREGKYWNIELTNEKVR